MPTLKLNKITLPDGLDMATYHRPGQGAPIVCIPGLTRNHRDFLPLLELFPDRPFYLVDLRGRGQSDWDTDPVRYQPPTYAADLAIWLESLPDQAMDWIGTSLGGILTMALAGEHASRMRRVVLNDIGPVIERAGMDAIRSRVGRVGVLGDFDQARSAVIAGQSSDHPRESDWDERTRALCVQFEDGWRFDYDPAISQQAQGGEIEPFWPLYQALAQTPTLIIRGECSDLFSSQTFERMLSEHPNAHGALVAQTGHAPTLKEADAQAALVEFLS